MGSCPQVLALLLLGDSGVLGGFLFLLCFFELKRTFDLVQWFLVSKLHVALSLSVVG